MTLRRVLQAAALPLVLSIALLTVGLHRPPVATQAPACGATAIDRQLAAEGATAQWISPRVLRWTLSAYHVDGLASAQSPAYEDPVTYRQYVYRVRAYIEHEYSPGDCTGPDRYAASGDATCVRMYAGKQANNACDYVTYISLQQSQDSELYANTWGYKRQFNSNSNTTCWMATNGHYISDAARWVRSKVIVWVSFYLWPGMAVQHDALRRSMTSWEYWSGSTHLHFAGDETGVLDSASAPSSSINGGIC